MIILKNEKNPPIRLSTPQSLEESCKHPNTIKTRLKLSGDLADHSKALCQQHKILL
jgi:hypothetical protein